MRTFLIFKPSCMQRIIGALLVVIFSVTYVFTINVSAKENQLARPTRSRLVRKKPTVYITFDHAGDREPSFAGESRDGVWLRLHNNLQCPIIVNAYDYTTSEKGIVYGVERVRIKGANGNDHDKATQDQDTNYPLLIDLDVTIPWRIRPGGSLLFSLPREYLLKGLAVFVPIQYEWETEKGELVFDEPEHRVHFYSHNLPMQGK